MAGRKAGLCAISGKGARGYKKTPHDRANRHQPDPIQARSTSETSPTVATPATHSPKNHSNRRDITRRLQ